ncbi:MAG: CHAP domain-containing protein [Ruminococcus sp.]|nr:CHAP domain-containing protein [Ruminococcus sp.]
MNDLATSADKILAIARAQIGTKATDIKKCKYNTWYYGGVVSGSGYDWCVTFVQWVFNEAGARSLLYTKTANCGVQAKAFQDRKRLVTSGFKKGDVVFFHWSDEPSVMVPGTYVSDHVGIIEKVNSDGTITTIEGNTGSTYNGEVLRRVRSLSVVSCAGRPDYTGSSEDISEDMPQMLYRVRASGRWFSEVSDLSDYAGVIGKPITDVALKATAGSVRYRVHIKGGKWLPYVTGYDISEPKNGYAGDNRAIDAVEIYYYTPANIVRQQGYLKAKYRVSPVSGGYWSWQYDNETSNGQDGYAGVFGKTIDRLQVTLTK